MMKSGKLSKSAVNVIASIVICAAVLFIGVMGMFALAKMKKPPAEVKYEERPLRVEAVRVEPEDVPVVITGYGEMKALDVVSIAAEVSGTIVEIHPRLELGEIIPKGELFFRIDPRDYNANYETYRKRLKTLERDRELAKAEYKRIKRLFEKNKIGTVSGVEKAEQAANAAADKADQMAHSLTLAKIKLDRCEVRSPFDCRIKEVTLEVGQHVSQGENVLTLANDSILEIYVPIDSRDARQWLRFNGKRSQGQTAWFSGLEKVRCKICWTEDPEGLAREGRLHWVVKFHRQTRTLTVAIRIEAQEALADDPEELPLVEGMFCSVEIPGRMLHNVVRLPRWAVSFENTVYVSVGGRLKTVPVEVARIEGEETFVAAGLTEGDIVITTRLIDPLENSLLEITKSLQYSLRGVGLTGRRPIGCEAPKLK